MSYPLLEKVYQVLALDEIGQNSELIKEIQKLLNAGGFQAGSIDGRLGPQTIKAFHAFKLAAYLENPNQIGPTTAAALLELEGIGEHPAPKDIKANLHTGILFRLPGGEPVRTDELIRGSRFFTWGEATAGGIRIPENSSVVAGIIKVAQHLDRIRGLLGNQPISINSWYRPPGINRAVGGVSNSTHLAGHAVDFVVEGIAPLEVYKRLNIWHGHLGGLGKSSQFTHLDMRGYPARWLYGR